MAKRPQLVEEPIKTKDEENQDIRDYLIDRACEARKIDRRAVNRKVATIAGRELMLVDAIEETLKKVFKKGWTACKGYKGYKGKEEKYPERLVSVILSDTHFGAMIDPQECPIEYGPVQESRRLAKVVAQVSDYKRQFRHETKLRVKILGDMFQNQLHDQREGSPLTDQFAATLHYLLQALLFWSQEYSSVEVFCVPGNHGRNKARHMERGVQQKWDAIETMVYYSLKRGLEAAGAANIKVNIGKRPYIIEELFDKKAFWTHGDTVLKPGYPGRSINVKDLYQQICRWNAARNVEGPFHLFGVGHVHFGSITNMPGEVVMLTNGCLVPPDPFSLSIGAPDVTCGQYMFESVRGYAMGDQRFINVDDADDRPELNKIITPYKSF